MIKKNLHRIYGIILSASAIIAGICLMIACVGIYNSGDRPYSPEAVKTAFSSIAIPVYIFLVLVIGGFILDGFFPVPKAKVFPPKQYEAMLTKLYLNATPQQQNSRARKTRRLHSCISLILLILGSGVFLAYALNGNNFDTKQVTESMIKAMYLLLPCMAVPFGYALFASCYAKASIIQEIDALKGEGCTMKQSPASVNTPNKALHIARWAFLGAGIVILVFGFLTGGTADVLTKAVNLCTECIGLG